MPFCSAGREEPDRGIGREARRIMKIVLPSARGSSGYFGDEACV